MIYGQMDGQMDGNMAFGMEWGTRFAALWDIWAEHTSSLRSIVS